ncbi:LysR family transcriptional regulator [Agrobacterium tumefaciens]|uniref:LysR family transcriptional regulator n=1 Tax=Agrobacterium tumefaciens TaxID=358 RepID=UPI0015731540|nr:LysR family transcriptional regulator [Agrobacterium tumefaciens]NTB95499.1 LysR family transcriptional regulator [Agrobacterium tumefaciens]NTC47647.1 LysR family transcriptional regulator [Agrobacterium tumefaciens]
MGNRKKDNTWDGFRYFLAVARTGTLSAAALQLDTDHTTVGRHVRMLEKDLGCQLFHRSNHGYELTDPGAKLLSKVEAVEGAIVEARSATADEKEISGTVRIGAPDGFGTVFLAPRLVQLRRRYPHLHVEIFATPRIFSLTKREAEIAVSLSAPNQLRVVSRRLTDYRLFIFASKEYLASADPIISIVDLCRHEFVGYSEEMLFSPEVSYLKSIGPEVDAGIRSVSLVAQAYAALGGGGLCVLPAFFNIAFPQLIPVLPTEFSLERSFHMHIHEDHKKAPHVRAVASFIAEQVARASSLFDGSQLLEGG